MVPTQRISLPSTCTPHATRYQPIAWQGTSTEPTCLPGRRRAVPRRVLATIRYAVPTEAVPRVKPNLRRHAHRNRRLKLRRLTSAGAQQAKTKAAEVEERSGVSVPLPHTNGVDATKYTGPAKEANPRECILIIDHETGELTLERLSNQVKIEERQTRSYFASFQIILKKTRAERNPGSSSSAPNPEASLPAGKPGNPYEVKREPDKPKVVTILFHCISDRMLDGI